MPADRHAVQSINQTRSLFVELTRCNINGHGTQTSQEFDAIRQDRERLTETAFGGKLAPIKCDLICLNILNLLRFLHHILTKL